MMASFKRPSQEGFEFSHIEINAIIGHFCIPISTIERIQIVGKSIKELQAEIIKIGMFPGILIEGFQMGF